AVTARGPARAHRRAAARASRALRRHLLPGPGRGHGGVRRRHRAARRPTADGRTGIPRRPRDTGRSPSFYRQPRAGIVSDLADGRGCGASPGAERLGHALLTGPLAPLQNLPLEALQVPLADTGVVLVPRLLAVQQVPEGVGVEVQHDAPVRGLAGPAVTDEAGRGAAVVGDPHLGEQRPAGAGEQALLHGLAACGGTCVAPDARAVVPEVGRSGGAAEEGLRALLLTPAVGLRVVTLLGVAGGSLLLGLLRLLLRLLPRLLLGLVLLRGQGLLRAELLFAGSGVITGGGDTGHEHAREGGAGDAGQDGIDRSLLHVCPLVRVQGGRSAPGGARRNPGMGERLRGTGDPVDGERGPAWNGPWA